MSKSARSSHLQATEAHNAQEASSSAGPSVLSVHKDRSVQAMELDRLIQWQDTGTRTLLNDVKAASIHHHHQRASKLSAWLEQKLRANGITEASTLDEISSAVHTEMQPYAGLETISDEQNMRKELYPHIQPVRRSLQRHAGKSKYAAGAEEGRFVYDMPVESHLQQRWTLRPGEHSRTREYLQRVKEKVENAVLDDNWLVDDYYTSLNGLSHPHLGKSDSFIGARHYLLLATATHYFLCIAGFASYADGVDIVKNALGIFAGSRSVVVFILVLLCLPPAERLQMHNLHVATVAYSSDCKAFGYDEVLGGNPAILECSSIGGSMRRFAKGVDFDTEIGVQTMTGGIVALKGDNPQVSALLATKESFGDTVKSPCDQCMVLGAAYNDTDLNKTFLNRNDPPCEVKSGGWYAEKIAEVNAFKGSKAARDKEAQQYGLNLNTEGTATMRTAYHTVPLFNKVCYDARSVEVAHDGLLGSWPQQCYMNLFFYTRDTTNPNYFGLEALQDRFKQYDWKGASRWEHIMHLEVGQCFNVGMMSRLTSRSSKAGTKMQASSCMEMIM
jgi:hypothetical protein